MTSYIYDMVDTWNAGATTFTAVKMNVTDTASASGSLLMDLQVGGSSRFSVSKAGLAVANTGFGFDTTRAILSAGSSTMRVGATGIIAEVNNSHLMLAGYVGFQSSYSSSGGNVDLFLTRRAAANLRLGAADAAGSAIAISSVASNQLTLASAHGLTTGAAIIITGSVAPSGTTLNVRYYARVISAAVIELYSTYDQATAASGTSGIIAVTTAGTSASVRLATPFQSFGVQDFTGTDIPGQPFIIRGSRGTGTGPGGDIVFQVAPAGTAGSSQNALATAFQVNGNGGVTGQDGATANTLALRNGTNAQAFRVYNTTDGTNSEFGSIKWNSNVLEIGTETAGSGTARLVKYFVGPTSTNTFITRATSAQQIQFVCNGSVNGAFGVQSGASVGSSHVGLSLGSADYGSATISSINFGVTLYINPGVMGNSSRDGAHVYIQGGTASTVGNWNGGSVYLDGGALNGTGAAGNVIIGSTRGNLQIADARDVVLGTTTGTKIGTATTQKIGFYNKTPVVQPTAVADATDAATAITQLNALLSRMRDLGLIAT